MLKTDNRQPTTDNSKTDNNPKNINYVLQTRNKVHSNAQNRQPQPTTDNIKPTTIPKTSLV